ncbi:hypothetical protein [Viscerimonas tarda]
MKQVIQLYRFEYFGPPMSEELIGIFTSGRTLKRYLAGMKAAGLLSDEDITRLTKQGETLKCEPNYKTVRFGASLLDPEYGENSEEYETELYKANHG